MFTFCLSVLVYICPNQIIFPVFPFALFLHLFWHFTATTTSWRFTKWLTVAEQCVCFSGPVVKDKWWNFLYSPCLPEVAVVWQIVSARKKSVRLCKFYFVSLRLCLCVCCVVYVGVEGISVALSRVCLSAAQHCILFSLLVWMCMLFLCVCVCKPLSRGSSAAVLLIGLTGLGLVTIVTAICFDYPFASTQKTLHTHIHTQAHTNAKQTKTICPGTFALLSKSYTSFFSSSFNCLILSCDRVCRPPVFRANKRGCFPLCCSSPLLLFFFGLCSGVVKIRCPLPWLSCGDMCS